MVAKENWEAQKEGMKAGELGPAGILILTRPGAVPEVAISRLSLGNQKTRQAPVQLVSLSGASRRGSWRRGSYLVP